MDPVPRPRPRLMAVGDSLAQGCRSLSVTRAYAAQSWPARVAAAAGWEFVAPDFPRPVLFDLEEEIRRIDTLSLSLDRLRFRSFGSRLRENLADWRAGAAESAHPCFDNLALSGAAVHDLYTRTAASSAAELAAHAPAADAPLAVSKVADIHLAVNGRFTLNPADHPDAAGLTPLDWVALRKPDVLVVQVGHNHGLYAVGADARDVPIDQGSGDRGGYWEQWAELARRLADLPPEVGTVVVCTLPKVGAAANLRPRGPDRTRGYADTYEPVFSASADVLTGFQLEATDAVIRAANDRIRETVTAVAVAAGTAARVRFLDVYGLFDAHDFKNDPDPARRLAVDGGGAVDNRYLDSAPNRPRPFGPGGRRLVAGGLQSADGMHPSGVGYARLASEALALLNITHDRDDLLRRAFADDGLLSRTPGELPVLVRLLDVIRDLARLNQFVGTRRTLVDDRLGVTDAIRLMRQVFVR